MKPHLFNITLGSVPFLGRPRSFKIRARPPVPEVSKTWGVAPRQHHAFSSSEFHFRETMVLSSSGADQPHLQSYSGPGAGSCHRSVGSTKCNLCCWLRPTLANPFLANPFLCVALCRGWCWVGCLWVVVLFCCLFFLLCVCCVCFVACCCLFCVLLGCG